MPAILTSMFASSVASKVDLNACNYHPKNTYSLQFSEYHTCACSRRARLTAKRSNNVAVCAFNRETPIIRTTSANAPARFDSALYIVIFAGFVDGFSVPPLSD